MILHVFLGEAKKENVFSIKKIQILLKKFKIQQNPQKYVKIQGFLGTPVETLVEVPMWSLLTSLWSCAVMCCGALDYKAQAF